MKRLGAKTETRLRCSGTVWTGLLALAGCFVWSTSARPSWAQSPQLPQVLMPGPLPLGLSGDTAEWKAEMPALAAEQKAQAAEALAWQAEMPGLMAGMAAFRAEQPALQAEMQAMMAEEQPRLAATMEAFRAQQPALMANMQAFRAESPALLGQMEALRAQRPLFLAGVPGWNPEPPVAGGQAGGGGGAATPLPASLAKDELFAGTEKFAKNATQATEVNMTPDDLDEVRGPNARRAHGTLLNVVHSYEFDKPGQYNVAEVGEFRKKLEGPGWHCSVRTRDLKTGGSTDVCSKRPAADLKESAIITVEPKQLTFIHKVERVNSLELKRGGDRDSD